MKTTSVFKSALPIIILLVAVGVTALLVISKKPPEKKETVEKAFLVDAQPVFYRNVEFTVASQGNVQPKHKTTIAAQLSGKVVAVSDNFVAGGFFNAGDVLLTLEQDDYTTEVSLAKAELAKAEAALEEEIARGKVAEQEWHSINSIAPPDLGLRKPQLKKEQANVLAAKAKLARAERNLSRTRIIAPYAGIVVSRTVDLGQFLNSGTPVGEIYSTNKAEVRLPLTDSDIAFIDVEQDPMNSNPVVLEAVVGGEFQRWQGRLVRNEGVLDMNNRLIYAVIEVNDPYMRTDDAHNMPLRFGQFVHATITSTTNESLVVVPRHLLRLDGTVLAVNDDSALTMKKVTIVRSDAESIYIRSGLDDGDRLVHSAVPNPYEGMPVRLPDTDPAQEDKPDSPQALSTGAK